MSCLSNRKPYFKILRWRRTSINIKILRTHVRISYVLYYWFTPWDSCGTSWQLLDHPHTVFAWVNINVNLEKVFIVNERRKCVNISYGLHHWFITWDPCGASWRLLDRPHAEGVCMGQYQGELLRRIR